MRFILYELVEARCLGYSLKGLDKFVYNDDVEVLFNSAIDLSVSAQLPDADVESEVAEAETEADAETEAEAEPEVESEAEPDVAESEGAEAEIAASAESGLEDIRVRN